jgi:hypothetical protein
LAAGEISSSEEVISMTLLEIDLKEDEDEIDGLKAASRERIFARSAMPTEEAEISDTCLS